MRTRRFRSQLFLPVVVLGVGVFGLDVSVSACSCAASPAPKEALQKADAVFLGVVERNEVRGNPSKADIHDRWRLDYETKVATFRVITVWKGETQPLSKILTDFHGTACGYDFSVGGEYLVYAYRSGGVLNTGICSRTRPRYEAQPDLDALGPGTPVLDWEEVADFPWEESTLSPIP